MEQKISMETEKAGCGKVKDEKYVSWMQSIQRRYQPL
jgi:hypothetical protein